MRSGRSEQGRRLRNNRRGRAHHFLGPSRFRAISDASGLHGAVDEPNPSALKKELAARERPK
jgi:hypothetical protein